MEFQEFLFLNPVYLFHKNQKEFHEELVLYFYFIVLVFLFQKLVIFLLDKLSPAAETADLYNRRRIARTVFVAIAGVSSFPFFFSKLEHLPTILGLTAVGIVVTMKDVTLNFVGWFFIHGSNGFEVGDRIEIDGVKGDVINIGLMRFTLMELNQEFHVDQSTNRLVHFPNHIIVLHKTFVVSQKMDFVWDELRICISNDSDWKKAEELCSQILLNESVLDSRMFSEKIRELSKNYLVRLGKTTPIVYTTIEEKKIVLSLRYLTPIREKRWHRTTVSRAVLLAFSSHPDIILI
ncbi:MAG: mechanosensitive ion channel family protein [Leptospira sp.]|nr:mechanosensitive ion channel family protein [Leptospira sp.]